MQLVAIKNDYLDLSDPGGYLRKDFWLTAKIKKSKNEETMIRPSCRPAFQVRK